MKAISSENERLRVLVVDDNRDAAVLLGELIRLWGNDVRVVHDGRTAIECAQEFSPEVILLDIGLPDMNGYEVARALRDDPLMQDVLIIAISGWGQAEDKARGKLAGFDHHIVKPANSEELQKLFSGVRRRGRASVAQT